jgi:hypothetical protein
MNRSNETRLRKLENERAGDTTVALIVVDPMKLTRMPRRAISGAADRAKRCPRNLCPYGRSTLESCGPAGASGPSLLPAGLREAPFRRVETC